MRNKGWRRYCHELNQPLFLGSFLHIWMGITGFVLLMFVIVLLLMRERRKKAQPATSRKSPATERPPADARAGAGESSGHWEPSGTAGFFGISQFDRYEEDGLLAILCDGMGGMAEGRKIAADTSSELMDAFPWEDDRDILAWIRRHSGKVYQQFRGHGGTTLVAVLLRKTRSLFGVWATATCSYRGGSLYALNLRQEFKMSLFLGSRWCFSCRRGVCRYSGRCTSPEYIGQRECAVRLYPISLPSQAADVLLFVPMASAIP